MEETHEQLFATVLDGSIKDIQAVASESSRKIIEVTIKAAMRDAVLQTLQVANGMDPVFTQSLCEKLGVKLFDLWQYRAADKQAQALCEKLGVTL